MKTTWTCFAIFAVAGFATAGGPPNAGSAPGSSGGFFFPGYGNTYGNYSYGPGYNYGVNQTAVYGPSYNSLYNFGTPPLGYLRARFANHAPIAAAPIHERATLQVVLPADDAEILFGSSKTTTTGRQRTFQTDPLEPGRYSYAITATWTQNGQPKSEVRNVPVTPGQTSVVDFTK